MAIEKCYLLARIDEDTPNFANGKDRPNDWNRFMGGRRRTNHPYISGYWYFFLQPPQAIFVNDEQSAANWWFSTAEGFTPHSTNLLKIDVPGMGGQASSYAAGREINRTFSVTFREYQNAPILNYFTMWSSAINDPHLGISALKGNEYIPANMKGCAFVAFCKPAHTNPTQQKSIDIKDVDILWYYDGVWPENIPSDTFASDISGNDSAQLSINFSFDGYPLNGKYESNVWSAFEKVQGSYTSEFMQSQYDKLVGNADKGATKTSYDAGDETVLHTGF